MIPIIKKELRTYFTSMTGYVFLGFFVCITGLFFGMINVDGLNTYYASTLSQASITFLVLMPMITMRLFAEEARQKTDQLLYTSPLKIHQIVLGKYFAAYALYLAGMAITVIFPLIMARFGILPLKETVGAFAAYILLGGCFIAVGVFISSLTENQIVAAVATFAALFIMYILNSIASSMPTDRTSSAVFLAVLILLVAYVLYDSTKNRILGAAFALACGIAAVLAFFINPYLYDGFMAKFFRWFSVYSRYAGFSMGMFVVSDIIYYITFSAAFIYLTVNTIEKRRWK